MNQFRVRFNYHKYEVTLWEIVAVKKNSLFDKVFGWFAKHNWQIISGFILFLILFELFEILIKNELLYDPFHTTEILVYVAILSFVGILVNFVVKANATQNRLMEILNVKHNVSMELTKSEDWEALTNEVVRIPCTIANVEASQLFVHSPVTGELETVAHWTTEGIGIPVFHQDCQKCLQERSGSELMFSPCIQVTMESDAAVGAQEYCLPLNYANNPLALLQFRLKPGESLSETQTEIFENIMTEMALALKAIQEQARLSEMRITETVLAERHSLSEYLHDNLSQNLAYLCLKLEHLIAESRQNPSEQTQTEFQHMLEAANQSYNIVRGTIETIHPKTVPTLTNLITEHATKVHKRSNIEILVDSQGSKRALSPEVQRAVFYGFQEALSNAEKYSKATRVDVIINWGQDELILTVSDNGVGFRPSAIDKSRHFGMNIMQERIETVHGRMVVQSDHDCGTIVTFIVPLLTSLTGEAYGKQN